MNLPFLKKKVEVKEYFLVLALSSGTVGALLFEKSGTRLAIVGKKEEIIDSPLDTLESNKLIEAADIVISDVESNLPENAHLEKTIFALPQRWVEEGKIKKDHLVSLKRLCESLELTPVGFIVSIEALSSHLHKTEGVPVTAIFIELGEKIASVSIVKNGNVLFVSEKEIGEDPIKTVEEVLLTQDVTEVLPSKIILLSYDEVSEIQQDFLTHTWSKQLPFLHLPQVKILDPDVESEAVVSGVASQMGFEHVEGGSVVPEKEKILADEEVVFETAGGTGVEEEVLEKPTEEAGDKGVPAFSGDTVGFFKEKDVRLEKEAATEVENVAPIINDRRNTAESVEEFTDDDTKSVTPLSYAAATGFLSKLKMPKIPIFGNMLPVGNTLYLYPIIAVVFFIILGVLYYTSFEQVTVTLYLDKNVVTKDMPITFSTDKASSVEDRILQLETREVTIEGDEVKKATGTEETGEKAKGEVTVYNKSESRKTFPKGTVLVGPNNLTFTLTDEIVVASTSSFSTSFSNAKGKVESSEFGKEYNLPSNTNFSFENTSTSEVFAKNDSAFSGGSSREITVVSAEDLQLLESALVSKLTADAKQKAASDKDPEEEVLEDPMDFTFDKKTFSKKVGDEASEVRLAGSITFEVGVYKRSDLLSFAREASRDEAGEGEFSEKDSEVSVKDIETDDSETSATFVFSSVYLPKIETADLAGKIAGKNSDSTYQILDMNGVSDIDVEFTRSIPFLPKILPFNKNNIKVKLQAKG